MCILSNESNTFIIIIDNIRIQMKAKTIINYKVNVIKNVIRH